ncbi:MAG: DUF3108 domain-containing protein [Methyloceanibacter sp.]
MRSSKLVVARSLAAVHNFTALIAVNPGMRLRENRTLVLAALSGAILLPVAASWAAGGKSGQEIRAAYRVDLAAFNLGKLQVTANVNGSDYEMRADGRFSLVSSMLFSATGKTTSAGGWSKTGPRPAKFTYSFENGKKKETRELRFAKGAVSEISIVPPRNKTGHGRVPVTKDQLKNVLDPFTAAFLSVRSEVPSGDLKVCDRTLKVFDGTQRFDIVLKPKRVESVSKGPSGLSGPVAVCQARYVPVSGYRPDQPGVKFVSENEDIEVWLVSPPGSALHLPYKIVMPTTWGTGLVTLTEIKTSSPASAARAGD